MRNVYFTSFRRSHDMGLPVFSCAVQWPKGYEHVPRVDWALILNDHGQWIRPRVFIDSDNPLWSYRQALMAQYEARIFQAKLWLDSFEGDFAMLCWCPHDRAAQRQMEEHGSFVCHTGVLGEFMERRLGVRCWYDDERRHMRGIL